MTEKIMNVKGFHPFTDIIGLNFTKIESGYSQCVLEVDKKLYNPHKVLHGGVIYSMCDTGMGAAAYPLLEQGELCATVEVKIIYLKAVRQGKIVCDTRVLKKMKKVIILESEAKQDEELVAKAIGTYSIFKPSKKEI